MAKRWRDEYGNISATPEQRIISFDDLQKKTWGQLGIVELDSADEINDTPEMDFQVTLTYTGLGVFDVKRGLWYLSNSFVFVHH